MERAVGQGVAMKQNGIMRRLAFGSTGWRFGLSRRRSALLRAGCVAPWLAAVMLASAPARCDIAAGAVPQGVWLIDSKVAVQIFDCGNLLCGRIVWLRMARNSEGQPDRDKKNPNPALRQRPLCGATIFWGLHPTGPDRWGGGTFYNPDDGKTYNVSAELASADTLIARIYEGIRLFGKTKILHRVPYPPPNGTC